MSLKEFHMFQMCLDVHHASAVSLNPVLCLKFYWRVSVAVQSDLMSLLQLMVAVLKFWMLISGPGTVKVGCFSSTVKWFHAALEILEFGLFFPSLISWWVECNVFSPLTSWVNNCFIQIICWYLLAKFSTILLICETFIQMKCLMYALGLIWQHLFFGCIHGI